MSRPFHILFGVINLAFLLAEKLALRLSARHVRSRGFNYRTLLLVGINILSGFSNVLIAKEKGMIPPLVLSSASMIIGGGTLFLFSLPVEGVGFGPKPGMYYLSLGWLSILSAVAISIWTVLLKRPGIIVSDLNFWKFLIPVFGAALSWILLPAEKPLAITLVGMLIIASSLVILNLVRRKNHEIIKEKA